MFESKLIKHVEADKAGYVACLLEYYETKFLNYGTQVLRVIIPVVRVSQASIVVNHHKLSGNTVVSWGPYVHDLEMEPSTGMIIYPNNTFHRTLNGTIIE